ncbi:MAG: hypothetical protein IJG00_00405 [Clostridia bacterium]|nr:hypothetical protein [Clostridia bacterium]
MKKQIFDERQISIQRKYGANAFFMLLFIMVINAFFKYFYDCNYASPINEFAIIMFIPLTYFSVATILTSSYTSFSNNKKLSRAGLFDLLLCFIFCVGYFSYYNGFSEVVQNGMHSDWFAFPVLIIYFFILIVSHIIRFLKDKKQKD